MNQAIREGIWLLIQQKKLERWDDRFFAEYEAGFLNRTTQTGFLFSRKFQQDIINLSNKYDSELRRWLRPTLRRITHHFFPKKFSDFFPDHYLQKLEINVLKTPNYYQAFFIFHQRKYAILFRKNSQELLAARLQACHP